MTKTNLLQGKMREKGYTIYSLAKALDLSRTGLFNKIHNKVQFLVSEVQAIAELLTLSNVEVLDIFFANIVEPNSTTMKINGKSLLITQDEREGKDGVKHE